ncbi:hypothetical protein DSCA_22110 [Desulfosarcina alkanivorans]|uniref:Uncharacterized protein n=1 Tax=Desulfosarcina alkanivorans TaxID=571177 RepID=A0A5K7YN14_9BACT|nr:DUF1178 family protein [Desulfosarcina alkanivorans]BBO68281.1 hypothetical protein DSCA_22110 [Desulfosarcina alkanivorans]
MIAYDLQCKNGHQFEGWFEDSRSFDRQKKEGLIACPVCEDTAVIRVPSTFGIKGASGMTPAGPGASLDLAAMGRQIVDYVEKNFDNVGADFAEEALKMHYGVSEPRNIRGVSTPTEEATLKSQGINFFKFPVPAKAEDGGQSSED